MNVEIGTEAAQFTEKEYINGFSLQCGANLRQVERNSSKVTKPSPSKSRRCKYRDILSLLIGAHHRIDRVLSFFSSRWNWDSPTPSPAGECVCPL
jgi:hypothetical protein